MIVVLNWKFEAGSDKLLNEIGSSDSIDNLRTLAKEMDISKSMLQRKTRKLKDDGLLVSHRYRNNNMIWMVGVDAKKNYGAWDAYQIAKFRKYVSYGGDLHEFDDYSVEEQENALEGVPIFGMDKDDAFEDAGYSKSMGVYWKKVNKILYAEGIPETQDLKNYIDDMYSKCIS